MEYDLTCKYPLTFAEFNWMLSKIMVRAIVDKLQKKGTENELMTYNLGAEGVFIIYRYQPRTDTNRRDCFAMFWKGTTLPPPANGIVFNGGAVFLALTTPSSIDPPPEEIMNILKGIFTEHGITVSKSAISDSASDWVREGFFFERGMSKPHFK